MVRGARDEVGDEGCEVDAVDGLGDVVGHSRRQTLPSSAGEANGRGRGERAEIGGRLLVLVVGCAGGRQSEMVLGGRELARYSEWNGCKRAHVSVRVLPAGGRRPWRWPSRPRLACARSAPSRPPGSPPSPGRRRRRRRRRRLVIFRQSTI